MKVSINPSLIDIKDNIETKSTKYNIVYLN